MINDFSYKELEKELEKILLFENKFNKILD